MLSATAAADQWKSWLDDLPLPSEFDPAVGRLQDFITELAAASGDRLAAVEALRGEARESVMQALASMGQAQEAYEAQLKAEAELAAAQQREEGLTDAVERLVVVLDRNDKKGPIPDVEMMFCWLAAQDIRAAFRAALSHNGRGE